METRGRIQFWFSIAIMLGIAVWLTMLKSFAFKVGDLKSVTILLFCITTYIVIVGSAIFIFNFYPRLMRREIETMKGLWALLASIFILAISFSVGIIFVEVVGKFFVGYFGSSVAYGRFIRSVEVTPFVLIFITYIGYAVVKIYQWLVRMRGRNTAFYGIALLVIYGLVFLLFGRNHYYNVFHSNWYESLANLRGGRIPVQSEVVILNIIGAKSDNSSLKTLFKLAETSGASVVGLFHNDWFSIDSNAFKGVHKLPVVIQTGNSDSSSIKWYWQWRGLDPAAVPNVFWTTSTVNFLGRSILATKYIPEFGANKGYLPEFGVSLCKIFLENTSNETAKQKNRSGVTRTLNIQLERDDEALINYYDLAMPFVSVSVSFNFSDSVYWVRRQQGPTKSGVAQSVLPPNSVADLQSFLRGKIILLNNRSNTMNVQSHPTPAVVYATIAHNILHQDFLTSLGDTAQSVLLFIWILFLAYLARRLKTRTAFISMLLSLFILFALFVALYIEMQFLVDGVPYLIIGVACLLLLIPYEVISERGKLIEEKARLSSELRAAHDMQMGLMPKEDPKIAGFDISGLCLPANEVGGDYFDYVWLDQKKTKLGIAIADVSGKAMKAAMTAVMTSGMVYSEIGNSKSPREILRKMNRPMYLKTDKRVFTAMSFALIDTKAKTLSFSNAGQTLPMLVRGGKLSYLKVKGDRLPLGVKEELVYDEVRLQLKKGDTIFFYTDGLPEATNETKEMYGFERMEGFLRDVTKSAAKEMVDAVMAEFTKFSGNSEQHDDMTVVVVRVVLT